MIVPIFPLPNTVLFPQTVMPLHVFEERYRTMTREAISGDGRIAIVLLRDGWEQDYYSSPAVHDVACVGSIENYEELEEGKYNIVLAGRERVRLLRELQQSPYRLAEVEQLEDEPCDDQAAEIVRRRNHIAALFTRFTELVTKNEYRAAEFVPQLGFEALVNMVASMLTLPARHKQELLEMDQVTQRCDTLIPLLRKQLEVLLLVRGYEHLKPEDPNRN